MGAELSAQGDEEVAVLPPERAIRCRSAFAVLWCLVSRDMGISLASLRCGLPTNAAIPHERTGNRGMGSGDRNSCAWVRLRGLQRESAALFVGRFATSDAE